MFIKIELGTKPIICPSKCDKDSMNHDFEQGMACYNSATSALRNCLSQIWSLFGVMIAANSIVTYGWASFFFSSNKKYPIIALIAMPIIGLLLALVWLLLYIRYDWYYKYHLSWAIEMEERYLGVNTMYLMLTKTKYVMNRLKPTTFSYDTTLKKGIRFNRIVRYAVIVLFIISVESPMLV